mgnify:FL=1|jgi:hypothetical protein
MGEVPPFNPSDAFGRPGQVYDHEAGEWRLRDGTEGESPATSEPPSPVAFRDILATYFKLHPNTWIDASVLQGLGGRYAWRTRVSECRTQLGMEIENRQHRKRRRTVSEYCFVTPDHVFELISQPDATFSSEGRSESE